MNPLPPYAVLSAAVTFRPSTRAIESKLAPRHSMLMRASTERFASNGGVSTDERNNPPAQAHASPFWRVVLREPSAVQARVRE